MTLALEAPAGRPAVSERKLVLSRGLSFSLLAVVFFYALVLPPLWRAENLPWHPYRYALLAATALVGIAWAWLASGEMELKIGRGSLWWLGGILAFMLALNLRPLLAGVPWMGDEDHHVRKADVLRSHLAAHWPWTLMVMGLVAGVVWYGWRSRRITWRLALLAMVLVIPAGLGDVLSDAGFGKDHVLHSLSDNAVPDLGLARYPYLQFWFVSAPLLVLDPVLNVKPPYTARYVELLHRLVPFLSAALLAWVAAGRLKGHRRAVRFLFAAAVATTPIIFYYSSILYLEMPAVLLMTIVCFSADRLLRAEPGELPGIGAWWALVVIGFTKETALPFLAAFVLCRGLVRLPIIVRRGRIVQGLAAEAGVAFCVMAPLAVYLGYRKIYKVRPYSGKFQHLADPEVYAMMGRSYLEQFAPMLVVAAAGAAAMLARRRFAVLGFLVMAFAADATLHLTDATRYIGYTRFNLFLVPVLIAIAAEGIEAVGTKAAGTIGVTVCLAAAVFVNVRFAPVRADGTRKHYAYDFNEHYFPYRQSIQWVNHNCRGQHVLFAGAYYPYNVQLYLREGVDLAKMKTAPKNPGKRVFYRFYRGGHNGTAGSRPTGDDPAVIARTLRQAAGSGFDVVVYHLYGRRVPDVPPSAGFTFHRSFEYSGYLLAVYTRSPAAARPMEELLPSSPQDEEGASDDR